MDRDTITDTIDATKLVEEACPERIFTFLTTSAGDGFLQTASVEEFDRAFTALDPRVLIEPFKQAQKLQLRSKENTNERAFFERSLVSRIRRFTDHISEVLYRRRLTGLPLSLAVLRHALQCAASAGNLKSAEYVWTKMFPPYEIQPDLQCYIAYMQAHIWNVSYTEIARRSARMHKRNKDLRGLPFTQRPRNLAGYRISDERPDPMWSLRGKVLSIFQEISKQGFVTNEETFSSLIIGLAKAGDLSGAESILKSVWNIDFQALETFDEEEIESPTFYAEDHPLRPTHRLLFAIVHAYSINNQVPKAGFLLDYVSRNYALDVPEYVWEELLEWTSVMSRRFSRIERIQGQDEGALALSEVEKLYNKIVDFPYHVKPSALMLERLARSFRERRVLDKAVGLVRQIEQDLMPLLQKLQLMVDTFRVVAKDEPGMSNNGMLSRKVIEFRRDYQLVYFAAQAQFGLVQRHVNRILTEDDWAGAGKHTSWTREQLPQLVEAFQAYLPPSFEYKTSTGVVKLICSPHRVEWHDGSWSYELYNISPAEFLLAEATVVWKALHSMDLFRVAQNLRNLPEDLEEAGRTKYRFLTPDRRKQLKIEFMDNAF